MLKAVAKPLGMEVEILEAGDTSAAAPQEVSVDSSLMRTTREQHLKENGEALRRFEEQLKRLGRVCFLEVF